LFNENDTLYLADSLLTDNNSILLFSIDEDFIVKNEIQKKIQLFDLSENDLQINFDKKELIEPILLEDSYYFESIGNITKGQFNWFKEFFPNCVFHLVTDWFGKKVNTLVIVLAEEKGKPVGILKTTE